MIFVEPLSLDPTGVQSVVFTDGSPDVQVAFGTPRRYFVVPELTGDTYPNQLRITHLTESSSTAEDAGHDIPLVLEHSSNVSSTTVVAVGTCPNELTISSAT